LSLIDIIPKTDSGAATRTNADAASISWGG